MRRGLSYPRNMFSREKLGIILILIAITFFSLLYLWQSWERINLSQKIRELEEKLAPLEEKHKRLEIEVIRAFSLDRIERIAKNKLGMVIPDTSTPTEQEN